MEPTKKVKTNTEADALSVLKRYTNIVADTGQFSQIKQYSPEDATTNPSLILQAAKIEEYKQIFDSAIEQGKKSIDKQYSELNQEQKNELIGEIIDILAVNFGAEILKLVPGVVSTEVDARLSFDTEATVSRARRVIKLYEEKGISKDKVLVKIASTWEGIEAAKILKKEGIKCNMTLIFGYGQAIACGVAGVHLISPFVGRIYDWHKKANPGQDFERHNCPGVKSVSQIYNYFKKHNIDTIVMGASFRNIGQIVNLSGCDKLTISPKLLQELQENTTENVTQLLSVENVKDMDIPEIKMDEKTFRWMQNEDPCMSELLPAGIRGFSRDIEKLEVIIDEALKK